MAGFHLTRLSIHGSDPFPSLRRNADIMGRGKKVRKKRVANQVR